MENGTAHIFFYIQVFHEHKKKQNKYLVKTFDNEAVMYYRSTSL